MFAYVRTTALASARTVTFIAWMPWVSTSSTSNPNGSTGSPARCSRIRSASAPAWMRAPSAMSPEMPAMQSK